MRRRTGSLSLCLAVALAAACGEFNLTGSTPGRVQISGDSVVDVGHTLVLTATVVDSAGAGLPPSSFRWSSSNGAVASVRCCGYPPVTIDAHAGGTADITASYGSLQSTFTVHVNDSRPVVTMALGDVVADTLVNGVSERRYALDLRAGDSIDVMVTQTGPGSGELLVGQNHGPELTPSLQVGVTGRSGFYPLQGAVVVPVTGRYELVAYGSGTTWKNTYTPASGPFTVAVRRSAPILSYTVGGAYSTGYARAGDVTVVDSLYLQNLGAGDLTVTLSADGALRVPVSTVTVSHPSTPAPAISKPVPGSVPVAIQVDATTLSPGSVSGTVHMRVPDGTWVLPGTYDVRFEVALFDHRITVVARTSLDGVASGSSGPVYAFSGATVLSLDPATGATKQLFTLGGAINHATVAPDGTVYFATSGSIVQYHPGQAPVSMALPASGVTAVAAAPDGSLYGCVGDLLFRFDAAGKFTALNAPSRVHGQMAYSAADTALYYVSSNTLYRYSLARNVEEVRGSLQPLLLTGHVEAVDSQGRLYVNSENVNGLWLYDNAGNLLEYIRVAGSTRGYALNGNTVIGVGLGSPAGYTWTMPVP